MDGWFGFQILIAVALGAALIALVSQVRSGMTPAASNDLMPSDALAFPVWRVDGAGVVLARNAACKALGATELPARAGRVAIGGRWFDVSVQELAGKAGEVFSATPVDAVIRAETALRDFRNTMSDTFAQLALGLGLFDATGRLQMFNPAMAELTALPMEFLLRRPHLGVLLDGLRDRGMLAEPKNWRDWRQMMVDMPGKAGVATHEETWVLPGGVTYRATLRPQAQGAFALMLEDISTEVTRTRRYRADMELVQSVIDTLDEGIAVFAQTGQLVLTNAAYTEVWGHDPGAMIGEGSIGRIAAHWRDESAPNPVWCDIEDYIATQGDRDVWQAEARLRDGRLVACRVAPIWDGATLAAFRPLSPDVALPDGVAAVAQYRGLMAG